MITFTWFAPTAAPLVWWHVAGWYSAVAWGAFILGLFGVGGGVVFVPVLLMLPGLTPSVAVPTMYIGASFMASARFVQLYRLGRLQLRKAAPLMGGEGMPSCCCSCCCWCCWCCWCCRSCRRSC